MPHNPSSEYITQYSSGTPQGATEGRPANSGLTSRRRHFPETDPAPGVLGGLICEYERAALNPRSALVAEFWNPTHKHGESVITAIRDALTGNLWMPPIPA